MNIFFGSLFRYQDKLQWVSLTKQMANQNYNVFIISVYTPCNIYLLSNIYLHCLQKQVYIVWISNTVSTLACLILFDQLWQKYLFAIWIQIQWIGLTMLLLPERLLLPPRRELPCFCWPLPPFWVDRGLFGSTLECLLSATGIVLFLLRFHYTKQIHGLHGFPYCTRKTHNKFILKMR